MIKMPMDRERFDRIKVEGMEITCKCGNVFRLRWEDTVGGGFGIIGVTCPKCKIGFGVAHEVK